MQNIKKAVLQQGNRAILQLFFFGLKFKFKSSQASKARLSSKHTGTKQNLTQNGHVMYIGVSGKETRD